MRRKPTLTEISSLPQGLGSALRRAAAHDVTQQHSQAPPGPRGCPRHCLGCASATRTRATRCYCACGQRQEGVDAGGFEP